MTYLEKPRNKVITSTNLIAILENDEAKMIEIFSDDTWKIDLSGTIFEHLKLYQSDEEYI